MKDNSIIQNIFKLQHSASKSYYNSRLSGCVRFKHPLPLSDKHRLAPRPRRKVLKTMATATATVPKVENPKNDTTQTAAPNSTPSTTEDPHPSATTNASPTHGGGGVDKPREKPTKNTDCSTEGAVTDIQKKMKRAERFGMPVQLSEQEKRNSRAERFGIGPATHGSETSKQPEELKRKARAERFGIVQSAPADEEARKKARLARFGSVDKVDSAVDDKKKARAIRFSQLHSGPLSVANDIGNTKFKTAVAGKADGGT